MAANRSPVVPAAKDYLDLLNADSAALFESGNMRVKSERPLFERWQALHEKIQDRVKRNEDVPLVCVFELEELQIRLLPDHRVMSKAWSVRQSYRSIVSDDLRQKYDETKPPSVEDWSPHNIARVRSDMEDLVSGLHWWYVNAFRKECSLRTLKYELLRVTLLGLAVCICVTACLPYDSDPTDFMVVMAPVEVMLYVLYAGFLGAVASTVRRIQPVAEEPIASSDPLIKSSALDQGHVGVYLSIVLGAVFALVLYLILGTGLDKTLGPFAPALRYTSNAAQCSECAIYCYFLGLLPVGPGDFAKLLVWSFIAGFSERFVPDILDRFGKKASKSD